MFTVTYIYVPHGDKKERRYDNYALALAMYERLKRFPKLYSKVRANFETKIY